MINRRGVRPNPLVLAVVVVFVIVGTLQVGCTSCLVTSRPTPAQRLEEALRKEALRKAGTLTTASPAAPPACPAFGSSGVPVALPAIGGHKVILSWNASAPADSKHAAAVGYCIYRGVKHKDPSPTLLNSTPFPGTSCTDDLVVNDRKYYYVAQAISAQGVTSINSNETVAVIPQQSNPSPSPAPLPLCRQPPGAK